MHSKKPKAILMVGFNVLKFNASTTNGSSSIFIFGELD
jgi:hypothetical protein